MSPDLLVFAAVDDSPVARLVVAEAERLAVLMQAKVRVLHVAGTHGPLPSWLAELQEEGVRVELVAGEAPWVVLSREARACAARMLVMGSHGSSGFQPLAPGGTTRKLLMAAPCPVVVVNARLGGARAPAAPSAHQLQGDPA
jgi:nucleotide-binding universal stress UspA family protein